MSDDPAGFVMPTSLDLSYVPEPGNAEPFYRKLGFVPTGQMNNGEVVMRLVLGG